MKRVLTILILLGLLFTLSACGAQETKIEDGKLEIVASVFPAYDFARQIGGERVRAYLLLPPGAETHSFEPTAQDLIRIRNCGLFFYNGGESEEWVEELLEGQDAPPETLCMLDCVEALEEEVKEGMQRVFEEEEEDEEGPEYDEHVWTSPVKAMEICRALCEDLCRIDPEGERLFRANLAAYEAKLTDLDGAFRRAVSQGQRNVLIFADRFPVRYFVEEYGLDYYAAFPGCADDTEPSARTVAFLIDRVREQQIPAVLTIEFSNEKMADVICEDTGCKKYRFHSCHTVSAEELEEGVTYLDLMWQNVETVKEALG